MWILGAIVGGLVFGLGGLTAATVGALIGAAIGGTLGFIEDRRRAERIAALEATVEALKIRLAALETSPPASSVAAASTPATDSSTDAATDAATDASPDGSPSSAAVLGATTAAAPAAAELPPAPFEPALAKTDAEPLVDGDAPRADAQPAAAPRRRESFVAAALGKASTAAPNPARHSATDHRDAVDASTTADAAGRLRALLAWLAGGNPVVRIGAVVLFFGIAFLLRYAADRVHVPVELRLVGVALGAIALLALGFRLRTRRPDFALVVQGTGVGLLYLTVFGALRVWSLLPPAVGFAFLVAIAVFSAVIAVAQHSLALAVLGIAGGFLAPVLASTGQGNHVILFGYYAVLNACILGIAWVRAWRGLNLLGFVFTFAIGTLWGIDRYRPELFATTEPFLVLFFLFYVALPILYARGRGFAHRGAVDATLVFGTPVIAFGLQAALVKHIPLGAAWSALAAGVFYVGLASVLWRRLAAGGRMLVESFLALGIAFGTLAIPLALDARWTSAAWALEGAALLWIGVRQQRRLARIAGLALQVFAGAALFLHGAGRRDAEAPYLDAFVIGAALIALAAGFSAWWMRRHASMLERWERPVPPVAITWSFGWLALGGADFIDRHFRDAPHGPWLVLLAALVMLARLVGRRWDWAYPMRAALVAFPVALAILADQLDGGARPLAGLASIGWPVALGALALLLHALDRDPSFTAAERSLGSGPLALPLAVGHALLLLVPVTLAAWHVGTVVRDVVPESPVWGQVAGPIIAAVVLAALGRFVGGGRWPFGAWRYAYLVGAGGVLGTLLLVWVLLSTATSRGDPAPLAYLPILNPLDLGQLGIMAALLVWSESLALAGIARPRLARPQLFWGATAALGFFFLNGVLARTVHHWADVPFNSHALLASKILQASASILWTAVALLAMLLGTRLRLRASWIAGAALLGVVVVKLLVVDLSGGVERIVSFIAVGLLMLAIGWFAPLPPRKQESAS
jgi:uncharacterized membrane protein